MSDVVEAIVVPEDQDGYEQLQHFFNYQKFLWTIEVLQGSAPPTDEYVERIVTRLTVFSPDEKDQVRQQLRDTIEELWSVQQDIAACSAGAMTYFFGSLFEEARLGLPEPTELEVRLWYEFFNQLIYDWEYNPDDLDHFESTIRQLWRKAEKEKRG